MAEIEWFADSSVVEVANHVSKHVDGVTRWELAKETGESPKAVSANLDLLAEQGYIGQDDGLFYPTENLLEIKQMIPKKELFRRLRKSASGYGHQRLD